MIRTAISLLALAAGSLAQAEEPYRGERVLVVAHPTSAKHTEWRRDWCHGGVPAVDPELDCGDSFSFGGEIYNMRVVGVRTIRGTPLPRKLRIAIARHALYIKRGSREPWVFVLEPAPADLAKALGVKYLARNYSRIEEREVCLEERLSVHFDVEDSPRSVSPQSGMACYPLDDILAMAQPESALPRAR